MSGGRREGKEGGGGGRREEEEGGWGEEEKGRVKEKEGGGRGRVKGGGESVCECMSVDVSMVIEQQPYSSFPLLPLSPSLPLFLFLSPSFLSSSHLPIHPPSLSSQGHTSW